jgi:beta-glucanase (GH16 family)
LTRKTPPAPKESVAAGGFPSVVVGATSFVDDIETHLDGWQLTWSDEFDGDTLDLTKWTPKSNASAPGLERFGGQQQWYDPSECRVAGGALAIRTRRRPGDDFFLVPGAERTHASEYPFVSCWVDTRKHFSQTYGRVEIRAQFPDHSCPGVWPQHWMLPVPETAVPREACWPVGGEIDIAAAYGKGRGGPGKRPGTVESGYHFAPKGECGVDGLASSTFPSPDGDGTGDGTFPRKMDFHGSFHTFAVEWDKESLKYFVDGTLTNELTRFHVPIIPRWPFYLILNTAVSPFGLPEALQCERDLYHYVDYVRVYQRATKTVDDKVWVFLATAIGGCLAVLFLAACCAMRPRGEEYEEEDAYHALSPGVIFIDGAGREGVRVDSEDGVDRVGFRSSGRGASGPGASERTTVGPNLMHRRRLRPVSNGGPREENLRLFDKPSAARRRRPREETARAFDSGSEGSLRDFFAKPSRAAERAPLIGGVALRMPSDANGRV